VLGPRIRPPAVTNEWPGCHHRAILSADSWPDAMPVPAFGPRMVCTRCRIIGPTPGRRREELARESLTAAGGAGRTVQASGYSSPTRSRAVSGVPARWPSAVAVPSRDAPFDRLARQEHTRNRPSWAKSRLPRCTPAPAVSISVPTAVVVASPLKAALLVHQNPHRNSEASHLGPSCRVASSRLAGPRPPRRRQARTPVVDVGSRGNSASPQCRRDWRIHSHANFKI
jgi:hypothetical protein